MVGVGMVGGGPEVEVSIAGSADVATALESLEETTTGVTAGGTGEGGGA